MTDRVLPAVTLSANRTVTLSAPYAVATARYAKGQHLVRPLNSDGTKGRAERLLCALNCRWTNRERGFVVSPSKLKRFEQLFADGWDACFFTRELRRPEVKS